MQCTDAYLQHWQTRMFNVCCVTLAARHMPLVKRTKQTHATQKNKDVVIGASAANINRKRGRLRPWHTPPRAEPKPQKHLKNTKAVKRSNAIRARLQQSWRRGINKEWRKTECITQRMSHELYFYLASTFTFQHSHASLVSFKARFFIYSHFYHLQLLQKQPFSLCLHCTPKQHPRPTLVI